MKDLESKLEAELRRGVLQIAAIALMRERTYGYQLAKDLAENGLETEEGTIRVSREVHEAYEGGPSPPGDGASGTGSAAVEDPDQTAKTPAQPEEPPKPKEP